jgi:hypothetical protein
MKRFLGVLLVIVLMFSLSMTCLLSPVLALPTDGLVAYYPFNGNANDESGNGNNGTVYGANLTEDRFGNPNSAYSFDGSNDYAEVPDNADFDFGTGAFTISAWIKTDATTTSGSGRDDILAKGDPTISGFAISVENNKAIFFVGNSGEYFGSSVINDGEWHHIVGTRDNSGKIVLYVDNVTEYTGMNNENVDTNYNAFIGKHGTKNESYFNGLIDDVCIYSRAVLPLGVYLEPPSQFDNDLPGSTANYMLSLTNYTGDTDSFDLSVSDNTWATNLSMGNTGNITDGGSVNFTVEVEIPALASPGDADTASITVTSVSSPALTDVATVTTEAITGRISVRAYIDGRSMLIIKGNTVQWHHVDWAAPGRLGFVDFPTIINGIDWDPVWPDVPDAENRWCNCNSTTYEGLDPALPKSDMEVELVIIQARHSLSIEQYPSDDNDYELIIDFDDNPPGGADWYECELVITATHPLPSQPLEVGGAVYPTERLAVSALWIALAVVLIASSIMVVRRHRAS